MRLLRSRRFTFFPLLSAKRIMGIECVCAILGSMRTCLWYAIRKNVPDNRWDWPGGGDEDDADDNR